MPQQTDLRQQYENKPSHYFEGARSDIVAMLPDNPGASILEIGCGYGGTGALALARGKCAEYVGIEISEVAARVAQQKLTELVIGNVESIELQWPERHFDALVVSEVLEHLIDPWAVLSRLIPLLKEGAGVMASSPNVSQIGVIRSLAIGKWELADAGVMDRTHLRWFTPESYSAMFRQAGFLVDEVRPLVPMSKGTRLLNAVTGGRLKHLFMRQIFLIGHKPDTGAA